MDARLISIQATSKEASPPERDELQKKGSLKFHHGMSGEAGEACIERLLAPASRIKTTRVLIIPRGCAEILIDVNRLTYK